ncbi:MAG: hypothetical protein PWR27_1530 [Petroclostridium sp.]|jgi:hypothetical protein|nr:MetS family NSS transporter small subunit [Petroclostridium xylanilyticum]MBZ4647497.1 hypothetical protein [Clostridia bacterium]MDK2810821.1 hypothetical protein [Petroclostridium sp.]
MSATAIFFLLFGAVVLWGGCALALSIELKNQ